MEVRFLRLQRLLSKMNCWTSLRLKKIVILLRMSRLVRKLNFWKSIWAKRWRKVEFDRNSAEEKSGWGTVKRCSHLITTAEIPCDQKKRESTWAFPVSYCSGGDWKESNEKLKQHVNRCISYIIRRTMKCVQKSSVVDEATDVRHRSLKQVVRQEEDAISCVEGLCAMSGPRWNLKGTLIKTGN